MPLRECEGPWWDRSLTKLGMFTQHHVRLFRLAVLLTGNAHVAEEVIAEVFARVLPKWRTGDLTASLLSSSTSDSGTIFHRSRLPLRTWFAAMWFVCAQKNGVSALGLQRVLGFGSYETAWA